ncbi:putative translation elongation factor Tu, partial [Ostertagia ostertagi]
SDRVLACERRWATLARWLCTYQELIHQNILRYGSVRCLSQSAQPTRKPNYNVGTIGHIDHGKTTLTAAITHVLSKQGLAKPVKFDEIDKAKEEKKLKRGDIRILTNMICGTAQMDAAILVIAATDGVMAQTKEHLILARQIGLKHVIIYINKADLVEEDVLDLVEIEARELLSAHGFDGDQAPVIRGSALKALEGLDSSSIVELLSTLDGLPEPQRNEDETLVMPVASKTAITGRGTVVIGTVERGVLKKGDKLEIKGNGREVFTTASDIQVRAGDHCGVLCRGVKADHVARGMWLGHVGAIEVTNHVKAEIYLLSEEENGRKIGIRSGFTDKLFCSTWDQVARFDLSQELLMPGENASATVTLMRTMPFRKGISFTLRDGSHKQTIAKGMISELLPPVQVEKIVTCDEFTSENILRRVSQIDESLNRQLRK